MLPDLLFFLTQAAQEDGNVGFPMAEFIGGGVITLIVALLGYAGITHKSKSDKEATQSELGRQEIETILKTMRLDIIDLRERIEAMEQENRQLEADNDRLLAQTRTQEDLIQGFTYWHQGALHAWVTSGCEDPPGLPPYPWQVRNHLARQADPEH